MPEIQLKQAVKKLSEGVPTWDNARIVEAYNELFPESAILRPTSNETVGQCRNKLTQYFKESIYPEEVVSLWSVVYPEYVDVEYINEEDLLHFEELSEK